MNPTKTPTRAPIEKAPARRIPLNRRLSTGLLLLAYLCVMPGIAVLVPIAAALAEPSKAFNWHAAQDLPPIQGVGQSSTPLALDDTVAPACIGGACVSRTTRPLLTATIEPDPDQGYRFLVYDLSGAGGMTEVAAEAQVQGAEWAPEAGLLRHGHVYLWTVLGADPTEPQDIQSFAIDLQAEGQQPTDTYGPFAVGLSSGEVKVSAEVGPGLSIEYRDTDRAGRAAGATPLSSLSDGWTLGGTALGEAPWIRVESFSENDVVVAHAMNGTAVRYTKGTDGRYRPPVIDGVDISFSYPALAEVAGGTFVMREPDGGLSRFDAMGQLTSFVRPSMEGSVDVTLDVTWFNGRLVNARDSSTGKQAIFAYLGERNCPRVPDGFDGGGADNPLCQVLYLDGATPSFKTTNFFYVNGNLSRVVSEGGSTVDFAYDGSGQVSRVREPHGGDSVASGLRGDDAGVLWKLTYDAQGRVSEIASPIPMPGESALTRRYDYGPGTASVVQVATQSEVPLLTVTFEPDGWRPLSSQQAGSAPTRQIYDDERRLIGQIDPGGFQTTWETDDFGVMTKRWGPAPAAWFGNDGKPLPAHADKIATTLTNYNEDANTQGLLGIFYDSLDPAAQVVGMRLLNGSMSALTRATSSAGSRMMATGGIVIPDDIETEWRLVAPEASEGTTFSIGGAVCELGDVCTIEAVTEPSGTRVAYVWVDYQSTAPLSPNAPPNFGIETRTEGGSWSAIDLSKARAVDVQTSIIENDTYASGQNPSFSTTRTFYEDALNGTISRMEQDGVVTSLVSNENANPSLGEFGRITSTSLPSGLTTHVSYYGAAETAIHPLTGTPIHQSGATRSVRVGSGKEQQVVYDDAQHIIGTFHDGVLISAAEYDERGRLVYSEMDAGEDNELSPVRSVELEYGGNGDPLHTEVRWTIGQRDLTEIVDIDLLGRVREHVDIWGVKSEVVYDDLGNQTTTTHKVQQGQSWVLVSRSHTEFNELQQVTSVEVLDITGKTRRADVTEHDATGRMSNITYSNGTSLRLGFDPDIGKLASQTWTDADGKQWTDEVERSTQRGRILAQTLTTPVGAAAHAYEYEDGTGYLSRATLTGTGSMPSASWDYDYAYDGAGSSFCSGHNTSAVHDGVRARRTTSSSERTVVLDYCYDQNDAPVRVRETTTPSGGSATSRELPLDIVDGAITRFETAQLHYDINDELVLVEDGGTRIQYVRDVASNIVEEVIDHEGDHTVRRTAKGGLLLDENDQLLAQVVSLPGAVTIRVDGGNVAWTALTQTGHRWWAADESGRHDGSAPVLYSPDGEPLTLAGPVDPADPDTATGWSVLNNGRTIAVATPLIMFGARVYVPALGAFTTSDPVPNGSLTPYGYADSDAINLSDPDGLSTVANDLEWFFTHPATEFTLVILLTVGMVLAAGSGNFGLAAVFALMLFGYNTYLSVHYFMKGDYALGAMYAFDALVSLAFVFGMVRLAKKPTVLQRLTVRNANKTGRPGIVHKRKMAIDRKPYAMRSAQESQTAGSILDNFANQTSTLRLYTDIGGKKALGIVRYGMSYPFRVLRPGGQLLIHSITTFTNGAGTLTLWILVVTKRFSSGTSSTIWG